VKVGLMETLQSLYEYYQAVKLSHEEKCYAVSLTGVLDRKMAFLSALGWEAIDKGLELSITDDAFAKGDCCMIRLLE
jgi:hypothetical protein